MSTFTIISLIVNLGLISLVLSLVYPRLIARYKRKKKQGEIQEYKRIERLVNKYLDSLRTDGDKSI
jgi:type II secretory pathway pseudopilin PulG